MLMMFHGPIHRLVYPTKRLKVRTIVRHRELFSFSSLVFFVLTNDSLHRTGKKGKGKGKKKKKVPSRPQSPVFIEVKVKCCCVCSHIIWPGIYVRYIPIVYRKSFNRMWRRQFYIFILDHCYRPIVWTHPANMSTFYGNIRLESRVIPDNSMNCAPSNCARSIWIENFLDSCDGQLVSTANVGTRNKLVLCREICQRFAIEDDDSLPWRIHTIESFPFQYFSTASHSSYERCAMEMQNSLIIGSINGNLIASMKRMFQKIYPTALDTQCRYPNIVDHNLFGSQESVHRIDLTRPSDYRCKNEESRNENSKYQFQRCVEQITNPFSETIQR